MGPASASPMWNRSVATATTAPRRRRVLSVDGEAGGTSKWELASGGEIGGGGGVVRDAKRTLVGARCASGSIEGERGKSEPGMVNDGRRLRMRASDMGGPAAVDVVGDVVVVACGLRGGEGEGEARRVRLRFLGGVRLRSRVDLRRRRGGE